MTPTDEIIDAVATRLGSEQGLERIQHMLRFRFGEEAPPDPVPMQWVRELYLPGLTAKPWHNPAEFAWSAEIEAALDLIRAEYDQMVRTGVAQPYLAGFDSELHENPKLKAHDALSEPTEEGVAWSVYFLVRHGHWISANADQCPHTCQAISRTPLSFGESLFSVLAPKAEISLHNGGWNFVLTCHLALHVPEDCGIRVGHEMRTWQEGKMLIFDDSFAHAAWNGSDAYRSCLIWDIWHPDMTPIEMQAMEMVLPLLGVRADEEDSDIA